MRKNNTSRRQFLQTTAGTAALGYPSMASAASKKPDSSFLRIGIIGLETTTRACEMARTINAKATAIGSSLQISAVGIDESSANVSRAQETLRSLGVTTLVNEPKDIIPHIDCAAIFGTKNIALYAKPLIDAGKPLYTGLPVAGNMADARDLLTYAQQKQVPILSGGPLSMMCEVTGASVQIDTSIIQQYYLHGQADTWYDSMANMIDMSGLLIGNTVVRCAVHGDIDSNAPVITTTEHEPLEDRDPVIGSLLTFREKHNRYWLKVHLDNDVIEENVFAEPGMAHHFERVWFTFLTSLESAFKEGRSMMDADAILNGTAAMIMAYESSRQNGMPVRINQIEQVNLPDTV